MMMNRTKQFGLFLLLLLCGSVGFGQTASNKGKEFWVGYGHHQYMASGTNEMDMVLYLSTESQAAVVTVTIDSTGIPGVPSTQWRRTYNIPPNTVISTGINPATTFSTVAGQVGTMPETGGADCRLITDAYPAGTGGAGVFRKKGIHIVSDVPIVAYAHIYASTTSGATMLLPVESWGYRYVSLNSKQNYAANCYNWMYVVATKDNTVIEVVPSVKTLAQDRTGLAPGVPKQITLMKGQIYQIIGANDQSDANGNTIGMGVGTGQELSGTTVRSIVGPTGECNPIAVFAGSSRTSNPATCGSGGGDNDNQQLFPMHAWGKRYLTTPFSSSTAASTYGTSTYKIAVKDPTTIIRRNGTVLTGIINNNYYTFESNTADYIESDKPIMVVQYMTGGACLGGGLGDPEMIVLSPMEQSIKNIVFYRNNYTAISVVYLSLVVPTAGLPSLRIDGSSTFSHTQPHPQRPGYTIVVQRWTSSLPPAPSLGQCRVVCDSGFTAITYGLGSVESYGYNAGTNLNNINGLPGFHNLPDTTTTSVIHPYGYVNTPMEIGAYIAYKPTSMTWKLSTLATILTPSADVTINNPIPSDSMTIGAGKYYLYRLPGSYIFNTSGTHYLPIELTSPYPDEGNCFNKETVNIEIIIKPKATATFTYTQTGSCGVDTTRFTSPATTAQGYPIIKWKWQYPNGDTSALQNPAYLFPAAGTYPVKLTITVLHGGIADTTINVVVTSGSRPFSNFGANPSVVCLGQSVTLSDSTNYTGTTGWWWDYGNGTTITATNNANQVVNYTMPGTYIVRHTLIITGATCIADTISRTVTVAATPAISNAAGTSPTTCGGGNGSIALNGLLPNTPYAVAYTFNGTPQTATITTNASGVLTLPNLATGTYANITVSIGSCSSNAVGPITITNPTPPATPTAVDNSPVCAGGTINLLASTTTLGTIVYAWTGPNGFTSTLSNPSISSATTAMAGVYSVTATQNGCTSAAGTVNVQINPLPVIGGNSFTNPTTCGTATGTITLSGLLANTSYTIEYTQNGNTYPGTILSDASGNVVIPALTTGTYTNVRVSLNSCWSSGVGPIVLSDPNPPAVPTVSNNTPICNGGIIQLNANSATVGTIIYTWTGPNSFVSTTQNPLINGATLAASGTYSVTASLNGCTSAAATTSVVVNQTPAVPTAGSNSPVCVGNALNLNSTTTTSGAITYTWSGPNGFNSTTQNPSIATVVLTDAGTYSVTASQSGCTSSAGTVNVTVNPVPVIVTSSSSNPTSCTGTNGSITLNGLTANTIYTINYTKGGTAQAPATISTDATGVLTIANLSAGNYTNVTVTLNGCNSMAVGPFVLSDPNPPAVPTVNNNSPICQNTTLNLTAASATSGAVTYSWTGPNSFTSGLQNPSITNVTTAATGTYSVTATLNGCNSAAGTTTVTINPSPTITNTVSTSTTSCGLANATIRLEGLAPNTLHAINYTFNGNPATAVNATSTASGTITLSALASGTYANITATLNGCTSAPVGPISLSDPNPPAPPTATGNSPICAGGTINLSASTPTTGAIIYNWSGPNGFNISTQAPVINNATVAASGTYSVTATLNSCTSAAGSVAIVVNPIPVFVGTSLINPSSCNSATGSITLSGLTPAAVYTVNYSKNGTPQTATITANASGNVVIPNLTTGNYTGITVTLNGCTSTSIASASLTDPAPPAVPTVSNDGPHCAGTTLNLSAASATPGAVTYAWTGPNSFTSSQQNPAIPSTTVNNSGVYSVTATLNGCTSAAATTTAVINVVPAQPLAGSNSPICAGTALNLTATTATPGAVTYAWNGPNSFTSTQQNPTIATAGLAAAGNYQVTASLNGCTSTSGVTSVVVNGVPVIGGSSSVNPTTCNTATGSINLNGLVANATYTVNFSRNGTAQTAQTITANASGIVVIPNLTAGNYTNITVTFNNCVSNSIASVTLNDPNAPAVPVITNNTPICEGANVNLTATSSTSGALTYAWTGPNGFSTAVQNPSILAATVTATGTYSVTASLNGCTSAPATTNVVVNQTPVLPTTTSNSPICSGSALNLTAATTTTGTINYSWTGPNGFTSAAQNPSITAATTAATGTYSVVASQGSCFSLPATITVVVNLTPAITATSSNPTNCNSATGAIIVAGLTPGASFTVNYLKDGSAQSGTQNADGTGNLVIANLTAGTYTNITVTANGCTSNSISSITLSDPAPPAIPVISNNGPLCEGATLILGATTSTSGTISWSWTGPNGFTSNIQNPSLVSSTTAATGNYTVTATQNSCSSSASRVVTVNPYPVVNFGTPSFVCMPNGVATFTNQTTIPDNSTLTFAWDFGDASGNAFTTDGSHVYSAISNYTVKLTATSANGCSREITKPFNAFFDKPVADFTVNPQTICQGVDNVFTDNSSAPNSTIASRVWSFGDGSTSTATDPTKRYTNPGKYGVRLVVTNTQGCVSDPFVDSVTVYLQPVIDAGISFVVPLNTSITFNPTTNDPSLVFAWSPSADFANPNVLRPTITATKNQVYTIRATGAGNCTATDTLSVKVLRPIKVPNAFSPNGDGINDTWGIENLADYPGAVVEIYDRSGGVIYRTFNYGTPWDGTRNGKPVPVGTYYYIIQPKNTFKQISGYVVLLR